MTKSQSDAAEKIKQLVDRQKINLNYHYKDVYSYVYIYCIWTLKYAQYLQYQCNMQL